MRDPYAIGQIKSRPFMVIPWHVSKQTHVVQLSSGFVVFISECDMMDFVNTIYMHFVTRYDMRRFNQCSWFSDRLDDILASVGLISGFGQIKIVQIVICIFWAKHITVIRSIAILVVVKVMCLI